MDTNVETNPSIYSPDDFDTRVASAFLKDGYAVCQIHTRDGLNGGNLSGSNFDLLVSDSETAVKKISQLPFVDENSIVLFGRSGRGDTVLELSSQINSDNGGFEIAHIGLWEPAVILFTDIFEERDDSRITFYPLNERSHFIGCYYDGVDATINADKTGDSFVAHTVECQQKMIRQNTQLKISNIEAPIYVAAGGIDVASYTPVLTPAGAGTSRTTVYPISDALIPDLIAAEKALRLGLFGDLPHSPVYFTIDEAIQSYNEILASLEPGFIMTDIPDNIDEYYATSWAAAQYYRLITDFKTQTTRSVITKPFAWLED